MQRFEAKWSGFLKGCTWVLTGLMIWMSVYFIMGGRTWPGPVWAPWVGILLPPLVVAGGVLFMIVGYEIEGRVLRVRRLLWKTCYDLSELGEAVKDREALRGAIRLCGIGGLFSFSGWFWSKRLGRYTAHVSDPARSVVLRFGGKTVVVSPEDPDGFVTAVTRAGGAG